MTPYFKLELILVSLGVEARSILMQSALPQQILAQIWFVFTPTFFFKTENL